jgi:adenylosuccinate synthase
MTSLAVMGAQWGDEGKAKIIDYLAESADIIARFQGGHNAGHTVKINNETFIFHLVPTGVLRPEKVGVLGNGMVISPQALFSEIDRLEERGFELQNRLLISGRAHLIMPYHLWLEEWLESLRGDSKIGTTLRGIGPAYHTKAIRSGIQVADLMDEQVFLEKLEYNLRLIEEMGLLKGTVQANLNTIATEILPYTERFHGMVCDVSRYLVEAMASGRRVLFEGAQGALLDVDHGTFPYVTSSNCTVGGICTGLGIPPRSIGKVIGITKTYVTRVGGGPMPSELHNAEGDRLREVGREFGSTTGRPRRCGWLDLVALRYAHQLNGFDALAVTKLDVLDTFSEVQVCTGYRCRGELLSDYPLETWVLEECTPEFEVFPGWMCSTTHCRTFDSLPPKAREYLQWISDFVGVPLSLISLGPERGKMAFWPQNPLVEDGWIPESVPASEKLEQP